MTAPPILVVMGVSGSGKTTVAKPLAEALGWTFEEGDDLHPAANVAKMRAGHPLDDEDRKPWLEAIGDWIDAQASKNEPGVITCSALKRAYRDHIDAGRPQVIFVFLEGSKALIADRLAGRHGHFMPAALLDSQFEALQTPDPDEPVITIDISKSVEAQVGDIRQALDRRHPAGS